MIAAAAWNLPDALYGLAAVLAAAGGAPSEDSHAPSMGMLVILGMGVVALGVVIGHARRRPGRYLLRRVPRRAHRIGAAHVVGLLAGWLGGQALLLVAAERGLLPGPAGGPGTSDGALLAGVLVQVLWLPLLGLVAHRTFRRGALRGLGLRRRAIGPDTVRGLLWLLAALPLVYGALLVSVELLAWPETPEHPMLRLVVRLSPAWQAVVAFSVVVLAPLTEEVFFRGLLQTSLRGPLGSPWRAIAAAAAVFAIFHPPHHMPALFVLGAAMGWAYERTGRLIAPLTMHAAFNAIHLAEALLGVA